MTIYSTKLRGKRIFSHRHSSGPRSNFILSARPRILPLVYPCGEESNINDLGEENLASPSRCSFASRGTNWPLNYKYAGRSYFSSLTHLLLSRVLSSREFSPCFFFSLKMAVSGKYAAAASWEEENFCCELQGNCYLRRYGA